jgi:hypothetical protein
MSQAEERERLVRKAMGLRRWLVWKLLNSSPRLYWRWQFARAKRWAKARYGDFVQP